MKPILIMIGLLCLGLWCWTCGYYDGQQFTEGTQECVKRCRSAFWNYNCPDECDEYLLDK